MVEETGEQWFFARRQSRRNQRPLAMQINDAHVRSATGQEIAVAALERWAGDHAAGAKLPATVNPCRDAGFSAIARPYCFFRKAAKSQLSRSPILASSMSAGGFSARIFGSNA